MSKILNNVGEPLEIEFDPPTPRLGALPPDRTDKELSRLKKELEANKLRLIAAHLEIPEGPGMWQNLALELARKLLPKPNRRGRKKVWSDLLKLMLIIQINGLTKQNSKQGKVDLALRSLVEQDPWRRFGMNFDVLKGAYYDALKDKAIANFASAFGTPEANPQRWERYMKVALRKGSRDYLGMTRENREQVGPLFNSSLLNYKEKG